MKVIVSMFEIMTSFSLTHPWAQWRGGGANYHFLALFDPFHRVSGVGQRVETHIFTNYSHIPTVWHPCWHCLWWHQVESIRPWKGINFCENVQLYEQEHCIFEISTIKLPQTLVFCWSLWSSNGSHFLGHFCSLVPWPIILVKIHLKRIETLRWH
jgi:hypothetical protein